MIDLLLLYGPFIRGLEIRYKDGVLYGLFSINLGKCIK